MTLNKLSEVDPTHQCTGYQHQFNVLDQMSPSPIEVNSLTAVKVPDKNRINKYLPGEKIDRFLFFTSPIIDVIVLLSL